MILESIRLRGFRGFKSGIGLDEVFVDFSSLPDGLIAITGQNGAGKTTLLDNLHPYRIQPFKIRKAKDWSPAAFSFYDQCSGSDACKELVFEMGGLRYRSLILIDAEKRKQEAYLYRQEHWAHSNDRSWHPVNDGKVKTYDEAIEKVCGSPSLFFTSVFRCQGAKNLSDYTRGDIMQIISELLNIDHIREQADKCRVVVNGLSAGLASVRLKLADIDREAETITALQHDISERDAEIAGDHLLLSQSKSDLEAVRSAVTSLREKKAASDADRARLGLLQAQLSDEQKRLQEHDAACQKTVADYDKRISDLSASHARFKSDLEGKIARAEKIASGGEAIRDSVQNEAVLVANIERLNVELDRLRSNRSVLQSEHAEIDKQRTAVLADIRNAEAAAGRLDGLDCRADGSGWLNPDCKLISAAVKQRDALAALRVADSECESKLADMQVAITLLADEIAAETENVNAASAKLEECRRYTRLLPELELAVANLDEWRRDLAEREKDVTSQLKNLDGDKWCAEADGDLSRNKITAAIRDLEQQIASFPASEDIDALLRKESITEGALLSAVEGYEKRIREAELAVSSLKGRLDASRARVESGDDLRRQAARYDAEIAKFSLLMKACSNDGIIALELDDAAPSIAAIVNDLLRDCYGSRFSVRLETQAQKLDGDTKETFDIRVFDADTGNDRSVTEMSGGQTLWIEDAITRGICLFNIHRSDRVFGTLYSDERDGALDSDRRLEFMAVKRRSLEVGTHTREFFISQSADLCDMADARIVLQPGSVVVQ